MRKNNILKNHFFAGLLIVLSFLMSSRYLMGQVETEKTLPSQPLRMMCYNIRTARGLDGVQDYDRIAMIIKNQNPDVVAIQELDRNNDRSNNDDIISELANRTQMKASFAGAISYRGGEYGVGILSQKEPLQTRQIALPGSEEKRTLLIAEFDCYIFCCTHLSLTQKDRIASVEIINQALKNEKKPIFIAGDFNAEPTSQTMMYFQQNWNVLSKEEPGFPADNPNICIDFILGKDPSGKNNVNSDSWKKGILEQKVLKESVASDHRPIIVEFDLSQLN